MATYTPSTSVDFNITIGLGKDNKEVTIDAKELNKIGTQGIHFELPPNTTVEIGSLSDFIVWLNEKLKSAGIDVTIPSSAGDEWPDVIKNIFDGILNAKVTLTALAIDQAAKDKDGVSPPMKLNLAVTGTAVDPKNPDTPKPISIINGLFSIVGGGIGLTRTYKEDTESGDGTDTGDNTNNDGN